jgi:hypothetical protein
LFRAIFCPAIALENVCSEYADWPLMGRQRARAYYGSEYGYGTGKLSMGETDAGAEARWARSAARAAGVADLGIGAAVTRYFLVLGYKLKKAPFPEPDGSQY